MKEVLISVTAPDGTERQAIIVCRNLNDFDLVKLLLDEELSGGKIHTLTTRIPENHDRSQSVYKAQDFLGLFTKFEDWQSQPTT